MFMSVNNEMPFMNLTRKKFLILFYSYSNFCYRILHLLDFWNALMKSWIMKN